MAVLCWDDTGAVWDVAFSPDGATLYTASPDQLLLAWDLAGALRIE